MAWCGGKVFKNYQRVYLGSDEKKTCNEPFPETSHSYAAREGTALLEYIMQNFRCVNVRLQLISENVSKMINETNFTFL